MRTFAVGDRVIGDADVGTLYGEVIEVPTRPEGYYRIRWNDGTENVMTWGTLHAEGEHNAYRTVYVTLPFDTTADDASVRDYVLDALIRAGVNVYDVATPRGGYSTQGTTKPGGDS